MTVRKKKRFLPAAALAALLCLAAVLLFLLKPAAPPTPDLLAQLEEMRSAALSSLPDDTLHRAAASSLCFSLEGSPAVRYRRAEQLVAVTYLDLSALTDGIEADMQALLAERVAAASRPSEVYDSSGAFLPSVSADAYSLALRARLADPSSYLCTQRVAVSLRYSGGVWKISGGREELARLFSVSAEAMPGYDSAVSQLQPIAFHYSLPDWTSPAPVPDSSLFSQTDDPSVIAALLETDAAKALINGQPLDWSPEKALIPGSVIRYYLDDTILALVWQECEHGAIGTFSEVFLADASQLRRKLADDSFGSRSYYYPTELARQANAVVAVSGDFYDQPARTYGIYAYNGELKLANLKAGQSCYFTDTGDMLFSYEGQFADLAQAQCFLDENHVMFSLSFGPVMVENGQDVTPYDYPIGEVRDTYARCAVGQLGPLHYLAMTINVRVPDYNVYVTLRQAADSMIAHGCQQAYTLDGGQTGSIIIGGELVNPVQFGQERLMSDIIYFSTAIPSE